ncbi:MarC family protein [Pseudoroseicyclus sp. CXY001]|uniref:MarC family protein n=1 Tax=Pseudoroseicyclus sp. CXY001 TaxID=3242492 RepID=UPI00358DA25F
MIEPAALITVFTTLFVIIDPPGLVPVFIALTRGMSAAHRRTLALRSIAVSAVLMVAFLLLGEKLLGAVGITLPAFRVAGGVLLFLTALDMLFERRQERRSGHAEQEAAQPDHDPSVFPLALPLIVGPGAITTLILFAGQSDGAADLFAVAAVAAAILAIVFLAFLAAPSIERILGAVGLNVVTRVLGMLLAALSVQFILDGLRGAGLTP